jgi:hypothetical protein
VDPDRGDGRVALNLCAGREPLLWLPALMTALFATLAWISRSPARPRGSASMKPQANAAVESTIREGLILTSVSWPPGPSQAPLQDGSYDLDAALSNAML